MFAVLVSASALAQQSQPPFWTGASPRGAEASRVRLSPDGYVLSAGAPSGFGFQAGVTRSAATSPEAVALSFLSNQARWFHDGGASASFKVSRVKPGAGRDYVKLEQVYANVPVFGSGTIVQVSGNAVEYVNADIMRDFGAFASGAVNTIPNLLGAEAVTFGVEWAANEFGLAAQAATSPALAIYDPALLGNEGDVRLVYLFELTAAPAVFREVVLVDAHDGKIAMHYSLIHDAMNREVRNANNTDSSGTVARLEGQAATGDSEVDDVYDYLGDTYAFYATEHGRDGLDGAGGTIRTTVRYCMDGFSCPFPNAFWDGTRLWFGEGWQVDDVTAHEATHAVTTSESNLIYLNQAGAINESLSDMWGEWIDLTNGRGNDAPEVRWLAGEDLPGGVLRDMADPPAFGHPDRLGSPHYYDGPFDNGGVHTNSGVGNKLAYLLTDGGTFNGYSVAPLGISLAADLMYEVQTNLLVPASNYFDLYDACLQAAINLGLSPAQQEAVDNAGRAVEIRFIAGTNQFSANTDPGLAQIRLSWINPAAPSFTEVRIRRSTSGFPSNPDSGGTLIYQGADNSFTDTNVTLHTLYYYTIWAYHGPSDRSAPSMASAEAGVVASTPTERFEPHLSDGFDLENLRVTLDPDGPTAYEVSQAAMTRFPTNPTGGTELDMGDDDYDKVTLTGGKRVKLFGQSYSEFYVVSNGRITFGASDTAYEESYGEHFSLPGISVLFDDFNPASSGKVSYKQTSDRVAVTFEDVPEFATSNKNSFQVEMYFNGLIRITYLNVDSHDGIVGVSPGTGTPLGFVETDFSGSFNGTPAPGAPITLWSLVAMAVALGFGTSRIIHKSRVLP